MLEVVVPKRGSLVPCICRFVVQGVGHSPHQFQAKAAGAPAACRAAGSKWSGTDSGNCPKLELKWAKYILEVRPTCPSSWMFVFWKFFPSVMRIQDRHRDGQIIRLKLLPLQVVELHLSIPSGRGWSSGAVGRGAVECGWNQMVVGCGWLVSDQGLPRHPQVWQNICGDRVCRELVWPSWRKIGGCKLLKALSIQWTYEWILYYNYYILLYIMLYIYVYIYIYITIIYYL